MADHDPSQMIATLGAGTRWCGRSLGAPGKLREIRGQTRLTAQSLHQLITDRSVELFLRRVTKVAWYDSVNAIKH